MSNAHEHRSGTPTTEELIREEALRIAKGIQKPGQTKEQTKLIAQGVAKGIEIYKKQQSAKARERDKARKRAQKTREAAQRHTENSGEIGDFELAASLASTTRTILLGGGLLLCLLAGMFGAVGFGLGSLTLGAWNMPPVFAGISALFLSCVGIWFIVAWVKTGGSIEPDHEE